MSDEKIIREVYEVLESRRDNPIDSYTSNIMQDSDKKAVDKILEKIGEECAETIIAAKNDEDLDDRVKRIIHEEEEEDDDYDEELDDEPKKPKEEKKNGGLFQKIKFIWNKLSDDTDTIIKDLAK